MTHAYGSLEGACNPEVAEIQERAGMIWPEEGQCTCDQAIGPPACFSFDCGTAALYGESMPDGMSERLTGCGASACMYAHWTPVSSRDSRAWLMDRCPD